MSTFTFAAICIVISLLFNKFVTKPLLLRTATLGHGDESELIKRNVHVHVKYTAGGHQCYIRCRFNIFFVQHKWETITIPTNQSGIFLVTKKQQKIGKKVHTYYIKGRFIQTPNLPYLKLILS